MYNKVTCLLCRNAYSTQGFYSHYGSGACRNAAIQRRIPYYGSIVPVLAFDLPHSLQNSTLLTHELIKDSEDMGAFYPTLYFLVQAGVIQVYVSKYEKYLPIDHVLSIDELPKLLLYWRVNPNYSSLFDRLTVQHRDLIDSLYQLFLEPDSEARTTEFSRIKFMLVMNGIK